MMASQQAHDLTEQFRRFIIGICDTDPGVIVADGRWHRFRISDTRHKSSKPGRYLMHADGKANGIFMDWRDGKRHKWFAGGGGESIDRAEIERRRAARKTDQMRAYQIAAEEAVEFWRACSPLSDGLHPYLARKGVMAHGTRQGSGKRFGLGDEPCVIVPLSDGEGNPLTLQAIREDGERRFWPGSTHEGAHFLLGKDDGTSPVLFCEGYSTAATLHEATGHPVVMCVNSGNMAAVARWAGHRWAGRTMMVAGDDDWHLIDHPKVRRNVGKEAAHAMAKALGGVAVMPEMAGLVTNGGDDFNDMAREYGLAEVKAILAAPAQPAGDTSPLPLIWFNQNQPFLSGNWLVKNVLPAEAFATIIGHPGCGKSFLALDMGLHIAAGMPWQGRKTRQGLVVYLAAEGQRGQQNRVEAWKRHHGQSDLPFAMIPVAINLRDREADLPKLFDTIHAALSHAGLPLSLLVVDTLNRTFGGGDENGTDMSEYVENVGRIQAEFGSTTIVVHHIPKNADTVSERGHGSLRGAIETSLVISADEDGRRTILCKKQKDAEDGWKSSFRLKSIELGFDEDGDPVTSCVVEPEQDAQAPVQVETGPRLTGVQREALNELMATIEAHPLGTPSDFPMEMRGNMLGGRLTSRKLWKDRWQAIAAADMAPESAGSTFRRASTDLRNKGLIGAWNDFVWVVNK
jgi:phage/plasmid primase-like uncharacterized protein